MILNPLFEHLTFESRLEGFEFVVAEPQGCIMHDGVALPGEEGEIRTIVAHRR